MKIDPVTLMFTDITDEEAKGMQEVATSITLGSLPLPYPEWVDIWLDSYHQARIGNLLGIVLFSLLLRSQKQNAELASAKAQIAELMDPAMPGENHSADISHFIDHSNEGWMQVAALRKEVEISNVAVREYTYSDTDHPLFRAFEDARDKVDPT